MKLKKKIPLIDQHNKSGFWGGKFGGNFIPETLKKPVEDLTELFEKLRYDKKFLKHVFNLAKKIGAYRIISSEFTLVRHPMEPLDSYNLINEFTNQIAVSGINSQ